MSATLDALLGRIFNRGVELALTGGINYTGALQAVRNAITNRIDVSVDTAPIIDAVYARPKARRLSLSDHFLTGGITTGVIGSLGWTVTGGAVSLTRTNDVSTVSQASHLTWDTAAASALILGSGNTVAICKPLEIDVMQCAWRMANVLTDKVVFFGFASNFGNDPAAGGAFGILFDTRIGPNYQIVNTLGVLEDTGVVVPADTSQLITMQREDTSILFYVGETLIATVEEADIPDDMMGVGFYVTAPAVAATIRLGYFGLEATLDGCFDDDTFLE